MKRRARAADPCIPIRAHESCSMCLQDCGRGHGAVCVVCGEPLCPSCILVVNGEILCRSCAEEESGS